MLLVKKITQDDIKNVVTLQKEIISLLKEKSWFCPACPNELEEIINYTGHAIGLYFDALLIGYATIVYCSRDNQLSKIYGISNKHKPLTAILDDVAILSRYRGKQYQLLLWNYIALHFCSQTKFLLASIHPDNIASLKNAFYYNMTIISQRKMYNGVPRYILLKRL
ncbi:hypothetical protein [Thomasclavelia cocleata]|jgi:hypothetical protein|uniref:hypothetical protein n=1 Tax=Thomasclavelia cocleata TaxID=69824 RepID=UPI00272EDB97|nr:hypothetical protein [Thomasclavelia cocleata]